MSKENQFIFLEGVPEEFQTSIKDMFKAMGVDLIKNQISMRDVIVMNQRISLLKERANIKGEEKKIQQRALVYSVKGYISMALKSELSKNGLKCTNMKEIYDLITEVSTDLPQWIFIHIDESNSSSWEFVQQFLQQVKSVEKDTLKVVFLSGLDSNLKDLHHVHAFVDEHIVIDYGWQDALRKICEGRNSPDWCFDHVPASTSGDGGEDAPKDAECAA